MKRVADNLRKCQRLEVKLAEWLRKVEPPYLRKRLDRKGRKHPRIEVGGDAMGVGKTTAVEVIVEQLKKKGFRVKPSYENAKNNPYLKQSYEDPKKAFLKSQKWFIKTKYDQVKNGVDGAVWVQDVHPEMDYNYALTSAILGRMSQKHFEDYLSYFESFDWGNLAVPDLLVYLTLTDEVLLKRVKAAAEAYENVDESYYLTMKAVNRAWLDGTEKYVEVLVVDIDDFDFSKDNGRQERLGKLVAKALKQQGW